jgi:hypothetical protein
MALSPFLHRTDRLKPPGHGVKNLGVRQNGVLQSDFSTGDKHTSVG